MNPTSAEVSRDAKRSAFRELWEALRFASRLTWDNDTS